MFPSLTPQTTPASHVAGRAMGQHFTRVGKTGRHNGVGVGDGSRELDQGNIIAEVETQHLEQ